MQIPGFPIISHQDALDFRKSMNLQLHQHPHIPFPVFSQWTFSVTEEQAEKAQGILVIPNPLHSVKHGPYLMIIRADLKAALVTFKGGTFDIGLIKCLDSSFTGAVLQVILIRIPSDSLMGGTFYVLDVLSYGERLIKDLSYAERILVSQTLPAVFTFPSRYKFSLCSSVSRKQAKKINDFATAIYLL